MRLLLVDDDPGLRALLRTTLEVFDVDPRLQVANEPTSSRSVIPNATGAQSGEVVLNFDWAPESNEPSAGWTEAAGDALFSALG